MSRRPTTPARAPARPRVPRGTSPGGGGQRERVGSRPAARPSSTGVRAANRAAPEQGETTSARLVRLLSVRALVLGVVLLAAFTLLFPTMRAYLGQRAQLETLAADVTAAEQRERELQAELERWDDKAYVAAQARERLGYVLPGETAYRVIDPEVVVETAVAVGGDMSEPGVGPALPLGGSGTPWYTTIWDSVEAVGQVDLPGTQDDPTRVVETPGDEEGDGSAPAGTGATTAPADGGEPTGTEEP